MLFMASIDNSALAIDPAMAAAVEAAHDKGGILSAKTETCRDGRPHRDFPRHVRDVVQVAFGVGMGVIDGGR